MCPAAQGRRQARPFLTWASRRCWLSSLCPPEKLLKESSVQSPVHKPAENGAESSQKCLLQTDWVQRRYFWRLRVNPQPCS